MPLPSRREAWDRLRAAEPPEWVLRHTACVEALAVAMARAAARTGQDVDEALVTAGAVLHDIGRSLTQDPTHAQRGADLLEADGADKRLLRVVARHTGAGISATEAAALGLSPIDRIPETLEEKIVAHADNLYSGDRRLAMAELRGKYEAKGLTEAWGRIQALHDTLCAVTDADLEALSPAEVGPVPP